MTVIGRCLLAGLGALLLVAAGPERTSPPVPDNPLEGRLLFESRHCLLCHGIAADETSVGPDLGQGDFSGTFLDLGADLWNHVPGMSVSVEDAGLAWPELSRQEVIELTTFLYFIEYLGRPGVAATGREVFRSKGCSACHGLGERDSSVPDLAGLGRFASPLYIAQAIWNHGPAMFETIRAAGMAHPTLQAGDLADLSAFIRQTMQAGPQERMLVAPGNPNNGRALFRDKGCAICHGADADGNGGGPDLTRADLHRSAEAIAGTMWNHAPVMSETISARGLAWPRFTTEELADLIAFLYFLPFADAPGDPTRGETVFATRSCGDCHESEELSPHAGPDLAETGAGKSPAAFVAAIWNHSPIMKEAILGEGRPWPALTGQDLRDLLAYLQRGSGEAPPDSGR